MQYLFRCQWAFASSMCLDLFAILQHNGQAVQSLRASSFISLHYWRTIDEGLKTCSVFKGNNLDGFRTLCPALPPLFRHRTNAAALLNLLLNCHKPLLCCCPLRRCVSRCQNRSDSFSCLQCREEMFIFNFMGFLNSDIPPGLSVESYRNMDRREE